jgi:Transposase, Mutator family
VTAHKEFEKPGQLPPTRCAKGKRRKRTEPLPNPTLRGRYAHARLALDIRLRLQRERNLLDHLPDRERPRVRAKLRKAWSDPDHAQALAALRALERILERSHPDAAGSLREGLVETLTLTRLGVSGALRRTLCSTNPIESMIGTVRDTQRNVKRWRSGDMRMRWARGPREDDTPPRSTRLTHAKSKPAPDRAEDAGSRAETLRVPNFAHTADQADLQAEPSFCTPHAEAEDVFGARVPRRGPGHWCRCR